MDIGRKYRYSSFNFYHSRNFPIPVLNPLLTDKYYMCMCVCIHMLILCTLILGIYVCEFVNLPGIGPHMYQANDLLSLHSNLHLICITELILKYFMQVVLDSLLEFPSRILDVCCHSVSILLYLTSFTRQVFCLLGFAISSHAEV